ncbi:hypothetical protein LGH82_13410 [Mesorhizobium sp. PAMC28654]|uniref:hypothetical protein n=1 Tax=Mesorhizobium sp. PAMC28654 TaxID=2880934 RepID=UPI001D0A36A2|nr:hypothetical protein [Mesorhizobium sp. PAMC28654]UDL92133.1 hypothetical protein LGH82_13410 [Mesorhizobium sp. PAMC28654]
MAHEKSNEINGYGTPPFGPATIVIYPRFTDRFAIRFAKQWFARYQPYVEFDVSKAAPEASAYAKRALFMLPEMV